MTNEVGVSTVSKHIVITIIIIITTTTTTTIITDSFLRQDHDLFQSEFSRECHLVVFLSNSSIFLPPFIFLFPEVHPVAAYIFFLFFLSLLPSRQ